MITIPPNKALQPTAARLERQQIELGVSMTVEGEPETDESLKQFLENFAGKKEKPYNL